MRLVSLTLKNFRNYQDEKLTFHPRFNLIIGKNAQGKTNILEAIYYLGYLNPFRQATKEEIITVGTPAGMIGAQIEEEGYESEIKIFLEPKSRRVLFNGKRPEKKSLLPVLLFEPREIYLFRDSPSIRRKFLDRALVLDNPLMRQVQKEVEEIVRQKNRLLKEEEGGRLTDQLEIWNQQLAKMGAKIIFHRLAWIEKINRELSVAYQNLSQGNERLHADYEGTVMVQKDESEVVLEQKILSAIREREGEEIRRRESVVGPHRDDWNCFLDKRALGVHGSQGENRSAIIALKTAQVKIYQKEHGVPPLFLLDDVSSELDFERKKALLSMLAETEGQVVLTTTEPGEITPFFKEKGFSFLVEAGSARVLA